MNPYENLTPEERLERIAEILVRCIYRAEAQKASESPVRSTIPEKNHYSLRETAGILGISKRTVQRWIRAGKLIGYRKMNGYLLIEREQVEQMRKAIRLRHGGYPFVLDETKRDSGTNDPQKTNVAARGITELKHEGLVERKVVNPRKKILVLKCPNDRKVLGDLPDDFFDALEGKDFYRNKNKVLIPCYRCRQVISF